MRRIGWIATAISFNFDAAATTSNAVWDATHGELERHFDEPVTMYIIGGASKLGNYNLQEW